MARSSVKELWNEKERKETRKGHLRFRLLVISTHWSIALSLPLFSFSCFPVLFLVSCHLCYLYTWKTLVTYLPFTVLQHLPELWQVFCYEYLRSIKYCVLISRMAVNRHLLYFTNKTTSKVIVRKPVPSVSMIIPNMLHCGFKLKFVTKGLLDIRVYYINTNEIPSEHLSENLISSHVKISPLLWLHNKPHLSDQKTF